MPYNNITKPYATEISFLGDVWGSLSLSDHFRFACTGIKPRPLICGGSAIDMWGCITYFDVLAQQRKQHEQQLKQSVAAGIESRIHSLASAPTEIRGTQSAVIGGKMECSQCISEIRQLDQFSELKASFRQC
uniref:Uncharacterized protein n=1 Tax=Meloidogyne floridensis TaxID=298350 RepID=A0A915NSS8_9BILA